MNLKRRRFIESTVLLGGCFALVATSKRGYDWSHPQEGVHTGWLVLTPTSGDAATAWRVEVTPNTPAAPIERAKMCTVTLRLQISWRVPEHVVYTQAPAPSIVILKLGPQAADAPREQATWLETKQTALAVRPGTDVETFLSSLWDTSKGCPQGKPCSEQVLMHAQWMYGGLGELHITWSLDTQLHGFGRTAPALRVEAQPIATSEKPHTSSAIAPIERTDLRTEKKTTPPDFGPPQAPPSETLPD